MRQKDRGVYMGSYACFNSIGEALYALTSEMCVSQLIREVGISRRFAEKMQEKKDVPYSIAEKVLSHFGYVIKIMEDPKEVLEWNTLKKFKTMKG